MLGKKGTRLLNSVVEYLYWRAQQAQNQTEHTLNTITLRMLGEVKKETPDPLEYACCMVTGKPFDTWRRLNLQREAQLAWEVAKLTPDYDPAEAVRVAAERKGAVSQMPQRQRVSKAVVPAVHGDSESAVKRAIR